MPSEKLKRVVLEKASRATGLPILDDFSVYETSRMPISPTALMRDPLKSIEEAKIAFNVDARDIAIGWAWTTYDDQPRLVFQTALQAAIMQQDVALLRAALSHEGEQHPVYLAEAFFKALLTQQPEDFRSFLLQLLDKYTRMTASKE